LERIPKESWTKDVPASWVQLDFQNGISVVPTCYSVRHGGNFQADSLRTWDFQGSSDSKNWTSINKHVNDKSLNGNYASHTWEVKSNDRPMTSFRILQKGHNSSKRNFLVISGFELYGELYAPNDFI